MSSPEEWKQGMPISGVPTSGARRGSRRRTLLLASVGALVLAVIVGAGTGFYLARSGGRPARTGAARQPGGAGATGAATSSAAAGEGTGGLAADPSAGPGAGGYSTGATSAPKSAGATPAADANLIVADDFSGPLDTGRWAVYESTAGNGAFYRKSAVQTRGGELQLTGTGKNTTGKGNVTGGLCQCGPVTDRLYGSWQVRARFDAGAGYGAVIGLWPQSDRKADGTMTFAASPDAARHTLRGFVLGGGAGRLFEKDLTGSYTGWHTYTVEWRATFVKMAVDGKVFLDTTTSPTPVAIPNKPMHLYVQLEAGPVDDVPAVDASTPAAVVLHLDAMQLKR